MSLRTRLAEFGFESNDDYDHALRCLFGQQLTHLRVLHVDGTGQFTCIRDCFGRVRLRPYLF